MDQSETPIPLTERFSPSESCTCDICVNFCQRPGWWTVSEAANAIAAGYAHRMMLEIAPDFTFGVLAPAFKGNEGNLALQFFAKSGCTFLVDERCELFPSKLMPLECRFCHHTRSAQGPVCHAAIETDWHSTKGSQLVNQWGRITGLWSRLRELNTQ